MFVPQQHERLRRNCQVAALLLVLSVLGSCIESRTLGLEDLPQLTQGAGSVSIDMEGEWQVRAALPVDSSSAIVAGGLQSGGEKPAAFALPSNGSSTVSIQGVGSETLSKLLSLLQIGSRVEIRAARFSSAAGQDLDESAISAPSIINKRYVNQATGRFAIYHLIQETAPGTEPSAALTLWLLTGAVAENRMIGRLTLLAEGAQSLDLDWWVALTRIEN
jgi:PIN domain nuclease of toxin-antitoxin system